MKYIAILMLFGLLGCTTPTKKDDPAAKPTAESVNQHIAIAVVLAKFYCENNSWPNSLEELMQFEAGVDLPLPVAPNWSWLQQDDVTFTVTDNVYLRTPDETVVGGGHSVSSINEPPRCNGDDMSINVSPTIGG